MPKAYKSLFHTKQMGPALSILPWLAETWYSFWRKEDTLIPKEFITVPQGLGCFLLLLFTDISARIAAASFLELLCPLSCPSMGVKGWLFPKQPFVHLDKAWLLPLPLSVLECLASLCFRLLMKQPLSCPSPSLRTCSGFKAQLLWTCTSGLVFEEAP